MFDATKYPWTKIYALVDPRHPSEARYIGKTCRLLITRYKSHLREARKGNPRWVYRWIRTLLNLQLLPDIVEIEECATKVWQARERYWIARARKHHMRLTNLTDGGAGVAFWGYRRRR